MPKLISRALQNPSFPFGELTIYHLDGLRVKDMNQGCDNVKGDVEHEHWNEKYTQTRIYPVLYRMDQ